jgi:hypothetical protein
MFSASEGEGASAPFGSVTSGILSAAHGQPQNNCVSPRGFAGTFSSSDELQMAQEALDGVKEKMGLLRNELKRLQQQRDERRRQPLPKPPKARAEQTTRPRQPLPKESKPSDFEVLKQLGKGAFGTVSSARPRPLSATWLLPHP